MQQITFSQEILILVVDDDSELAALLRDVLHNENRQVNFATSGKQAEDLLQKHPYSMLITDIQMPDMDGLTLMTKAQEILPDILTIVITGYASIEIALQAVKKGAYDFLRKPFRLEEIKIRVENAVERILCARKVAAMSQRLEKHEAKLKYLQKKADNEPSSNTPVVIAPGWLPPDLVRGSMEWSLQSIITEIERLGELRDKGFLTDEEFMTLKNKTLTTK